ncbi:MAG: precorrin-6y C5,15-methyltransferase (decarboxylating) subunit CbiE [Desulfocapsaceae bacterium]|nr:precorrin-6y C5,15-methyltransferase (decarboxylating) subunit CbiE [Desulfocapsaceae bacterium]
MSEIMVLGIAGSSIQPFQARIMEECRLIVCGNRLAQQVVQNRQAIFPITPLNEALTKIEDELSQGSIAVLASGDPLFYGIGKRLLEHFGKEKVTFIPALSSMQEAFARFKISWDDATIISLHGRAGKHLPGLLLNSTKTFVFTDKNNTPQAIAQQLLRYLELIGDEPARQSCVLHVAENIGLPDEKITTASLGQVAIQEFGDLNVLLVEFPRQKREGIFGLYEQDLAHSRGLITKDEVRAATLHRLCLPKSGIFWDIGGGSGSISIEAASLNPQLTVYTVEKKAEELSNIKENICRYQSYNVVPIGGSALQVLDDLPDPDRVFIGGSGGDLGKIISVAASRLAENGRIVVNGVTSKTIEQAPQLMRKAGLQVETSTITVSRSGPDGPISFNPITIMVGRK